MRTTSRLLLPETAVPVREQDDGNYHVHEYYWEHHDSWTSWLRASGTWYWRTSRSWTRWLRASLREHTGSLHEHDDGKHHVHQHDHCEHHEHEHPVHEQDNWVHHRHEQHNVWHNEPDDWAHIIHEYLLNEKAYSEQVTSDHPCRSTEYEQRWMILIITETKETLIGI